ncbi:TIGR01777 family oxidoreductase [Pelosinus sp. sgz500959]|uniref:TIGR01777 family oxidoreductase n=1 Tax=Pelosinus sp. sgz500959 TaxID=3242472 RepID=UPI00366B8089
MNILVTGGTGFVGKALVNRLVLQGFTPYIVSRSHAVDSSGSLVAIPTVGELFPPDLIGRVSQVINLAGESIAGHRWNRQVRDRILTSRVEMTRCLVGSIRRNREQGMPYPKVLVNASAIGYYGTHPSRIFTEKSENGDDFLADVCRCWEGEALQAESLGVRVICLRFGHILDCDGGMLQRVAFPFRFGVGGYLGDGQQWMSWIHRKELIEIIIQSLEGDNWQGVYNLTTPYAVTMKEFMEVLGRVIGSKSRVRIPSYMARLLFGEMAQEVLLKGQKVFPERLLKEGYIFQYPHLEETLVDIYRK